MLCILCYVVVYVCAVMMKVENENKNKNKNKNKNDIYNNNDVTVKRLPDADEFFAAALALSYGEEDKEKKEN